MNSGVAAQVGSFGPYKLNVTVPLGENAPVSVAVSLMVVPTAPLADAWAVTDGPAWVTVKLRVTVPAGS